MIWYICASGVGWRGLARGVFEIAHAQEELFAVVADDGVEDEAADEGEGCEEVEAGGEDGEGDVDDVADADVIENREGAGDDREEEKEQGDLGEEEHWLEILEDRDDDAEDAEAIGEGVQFRERTLGTAAEGDIDIALDEGFIDGLDGELGFDFEPFGEHGDVAVKGAGEEAVAGEEIAAMGLEDGLDEAGEGEIGPGVG